MELVSAAAEVIVAATGEEIVDAAIIVRNTCRVTTNSGRIFRVTFHVDGVLRRVEEPVTGAFLEMERGVGNSQEFTFYPDDGHTDLP